MVVFELIGSGAWIDWGSRGKSTRIGLYSTRKKAELKIEEIKQNKNWKMDWSSFDIHEVEVK
jgi:hypothetical protein